MAGRKNIKPAFDATVAQTAVPIHVVYRALASLRPDERNSRKHGAKQIAAIEASLLRYGWTQPILVAGDQIVAGHARHQAAANLLRQGRLIARHADASIAPTIDLSALSASERRAYVIADNRLAEGASWDNDMLRVELSELQVGGFDLSLTGFSVPEIGVLLGVTGEAEGAKLGPGMQYQVVVECEGEAHQAEVLGEMRVRGLKARPLIL